MTILILALHSYLSQEIKMFYQDLHGDILNVMPCHPTVNDVTDNYFGAKNVKKKIKS